MTTKRGVGRPKIDLSDADAAWVAAWLGARFRRAEEWRKKDRMDAARALYEVRTSEMVNALELAPRDVDRKKVSEKKAYKCVEAVSRARIIVRRLEPRRGSYLRHRRLPVVNRVGKIVLPLTGRPLPGWWVIRDAYSAVVDSKVGPQNLPMFVEILFPR